MDWIERATGRRKPQKHKTDEERKAAAKESKRRSAEKARARKKAEEEALVCLESSMKTRSNE